ncbi:MAG: YihY/virulence factor BrkB family protein [Chitinophagaceae bacterium]|nr:YihY/virulence factor BrkB family protein [Chitinophagaceae bacterium]
MKFLIQIKNTGRQLVNAYRLLLKNDPLRLAGATAFFTSFALPPILLLLIQLLSLLFNRKAVSQELFTELGSILGDDGVRQLVETLRGFRGLAINWPMAIAGFFFLLFVATTLFRVIQSSLNQLWMIQKTGDKRFKMAMVTRLKSTGLIIFTGLLFMASLAAGSLKLIFGNFLDDKIPGSGVYSNGTLSTLVSIAIVCTWFTVLFRYLPDGKPKWRVALTGGLLTSILYNIGAFVLKLLLLNSNIGVVYGASASVVLLLLFVFYASLIFYYGAAFTKVWGEYLDQPIQPVIHAELYENIHIENKE